MNEWLSLGEMIDCLKSNDYAEDEEKEWVVRWVDEKLVFTFLNNKGGRQTLYLNDLKKKWRVIRTYVTYEEAFKAHMQQKKTITYHHNGNLKYTFKHELEPGQFKEIYYDSINLHEMLSKKWTIDD
ncbi:hypothetical protein [Virgibacillus salexigens]|uniref:Uncharacterized protein n=1 Tax=Virgibacillus massiliensis TaxID=1462526 RepID=A0A024QHF4_9BACI|nr:hypothetical protein [Virgibacillus massiliensis]CDQ41924.1 hypothetical protein BN990_04303 [Virgibacillus massiliensis]